MDPAKTGAQDAKPGLIKVLRGSGFAGPLQGVPLGDGVA
jgi:hypothetical protein